MKNPTLLYPVEMSHVEEIEIELPFYGKNLETDPTEFVYVDKGGKATVIRKYAGIWRSLITISDARDMNHPGLNDYYEATFEEFREAFNDFIRQMSNIQLQNRVIKEVV